MLPQRYYRFRSKTDDFGIGVYSSGCSGATFAIATTHLCLVCPLSSSALLI